MGCAFSLEQSFRDQKRSVLAGAPVSTRLLPWREPSTSPTDADKAQAASSVKCIVLFDQVMVMVHLSKALRSCYPKQ